MTRLLNETICADAGWTSGRQFNGQTEKYAKEEFLIFPVPRASVRSSSKRDFNLRRDRFAKLPAENNRFSDREKKLRITVPVIMFDIRLSSVLAAILTSDLCIYPWFLPIMSDVPRYGK